MRTPLNAWEGHSSFLHGLNEGQKRPLESTGRNTQPHLAAPGEHSRSCKGEQGQLWQRAGTSLQGWGHLCLREGTFGALCLGLYSLASW